MGTQSVAVASCGLVPTPSQSGKAKTADSWARRGRAAERILQKAADTGCSAVARILRDPKPPNHTPQPPALKNGLVEIVVQGQVLLGTCPERET